MSERTGAANRLAEESSPYLLLHAHNPVDWHPWGAEAIERARREEKPIFLSVGYSTCYWCHVMERESFSDETTAAMMNERFVNVKVDREERPDVDEIYMTATQILAGQGGWPNSVFLTPELEPFYAGTYFPPQDAHGRPGFRTVLASLADAWESRRKDVHMQAAEVAQAMRRVLQERFAPGERPAPAGVVLRAYQSLERQHDPVQGGFGGAPKFPTPSNLFLLRELVVGGVGETPDAEAMLTGTLDAMARGGIYDQLGGGFHRYSTDARWLVPHFEKMLYDNGLLLELYALEHERTGAAEWARIARETVDFLAREMIDESGAFWSAIDAETDGREGAFYVWSADELRDVLGEEDFHFLAPIYGFGGAPSFEGTEHVLHLPKPLAEQAETRRGTVAELLAEIAPLREKLFDARAERERPATDAKVLADWNGMAIRSMAYAGRALGDEDVVARAAKAADAVLATMRPAGESLLHSVRAGEGRIAAYLSDYAFLVRGLLALHEVTGEAAWLASARELTEEQEERLAHPDGGWWNAAQSDDLIVRSQEVFDGATPSANGIAVLNLLDLHEATGDAVYRQRAEKALAAFGPMLERVPEAARTLSVANLRYRSAEGGELTSGASGAGATKLTDEAENLVAHELELGRPKEDGTRDFYLHLRIVPGWHLYAHDAPADTSTPTTLSVKWGDGDLELLDVVYPLGQGLDDIGLYTGAIALAGRLRGTGSLVLTYQPCDDTRCLAKVEREIPV
jgi:uncharacterized protein